MIAHNAQFDAWDHPRVCGEKATEDQLTAALSGSPPRMRGKVLGDLAGRELTGITPAYAGKSAMLFWTP